MPTSALSPYATIDQLPPEERQILDAHALFWGYTIRSTLLDLLRPLFSRNPAGRAFDHEGVKAASASLKAKGLLEEQPQRQGFWRVKEPERSAAYQALLDTLPGELLRRVLSNVAHYHTGPGLYRWPVSDPMASAAVVRVHLLTDTPAAELTTFEHLLSRCSDADRIVATAFDAMPDAPLVRRLPPKWRGEMFSRMLVRLGTYWRAENRSVVALAQQELSKPDGELPLAVRYQTAETLLHSGQPEEVLRLLEKLETPDADILRAAVLAQQGGWPEAQAGFEKGLKLLRKEFGKSRRLLPPGVSMGYPLALLAQPSPKSVEAARKYCLAESGSRQPSPHEGWGLWVHAADVRLGNAPIEAQAFWLHARDVQDPGLDGLWRCLLRAWLGPSVAKPPASGIAQATDAEAVIALRSRLQACGFAWLDAQVAAAENVYQGGEAPAAFFAPGSQESWRSVLTSLQSLAGDAAVADKATDTRILWSLTLGDEGFVEVLQPLEQKRGARGWSKPKPLSLARLHDNEKLAPWDARVARAVSVDGCV